MGATFWPLVHSLQWLSSLKVSQASFTYSGRARNLRCCPNVLSFGTSLHITGSRRRIISDSSATQTLACVSWRVATSLASWMWRVPSPVFARPPLLFEVILTCNSIKTNLGAKCKLMSHVCIQSDSGVQQFGNCRLILLFCLFRFHFFFFFMDGELAFELESSSCSTGSRDRTISWSSSGITSPKSALHRTATIWDHISLFHRDVNTSTN